MKRFLIIAILILLPLRGRTQAANPQGTFSSAISSNSPSLVLNFDDLTTSFKDQVSGSAMVGTLNVTPTDYPPIPGSFSGSAVVGDSYINAEGNVKPFPAGFLYSVTVCYATAPSSGQPLDILIGNSGSHTVQAIIPVTGIASVSGCQTLYSGVNYTGVSVTAGEAIGEYTASGIAPELGTVPVTHLNVGCASAPTVGGILGCFYESYPIAIAGTVISSTYTSGSVTTKQPGFDSTNSSNYSAEFPYNGFAAAPNDTLGAIDWNSPWTILIHIDRLNWDHVGTMVIASKGDIGQVNGNWWKLIIRPSNGTGPGSQFCFYRNGFGAVVVSQLLCTSNTDGIPNGPGGVNLNWDIAIESTAVTGDSGALSMYLNGSAVLQTLVGSTGGFGQVALTVASGGTGYANPTYFTSTGGGPNCNISGQAVATSGVLTSASVNYSLGQHNYGCTSVPTIVLTAPTGTGGSITAANVATSMNSTTYPLMVPGYISGGAVYGVGGSDMSQNAVYVDEFAIFPSALTFGQITNIFYTTKFYQNFLYPGLAANPPLVILGTQGCGPDFSGDQTVAMTIGAAEQGLIHLIGIVDDDGMATGSNSVAWYRQMLDQAGMNDVPVSVGPNSTSVNGGGCPAANLTAYNASTPQAASSYESSVTMYRTLFAKYSSTPIYVLVTQTGNGYANFLTSGADGISSLTGLQLQTRNANNGGYINLSQGNLGLTPPYYQTIYNSNGTMPIYMFGGDPTNGGPGITASRTGNDPLWLAASEMGGGDVTSGYTQLNIAQILSPYFYGGVVVNYSGGTGYANSTPFTSTGGGPYCSFTGIMTASSGVPNGIETYWGLNFPPTSSYNGLGSGCFPIFFTGTASGTNLTVTAVTGYINAGTTITGTSIPAGTTILSQTSGTTGGAGIYVTSGSTSASATAVTGSPTVVLTAPTGTGATFTAMSGFNYTCYGTGGCSAQYVVWPNVWSVQASGVGTQAIFGMFQNSLMDTPVNGQPRQ